MFIQMVTGIVDNWARLNATLRIYHYFYRLNMVPATITSFENYYSMNLYLVVSYSVHSNPMYRKSIAPSPPHTFAKREQDFSTGTFISACSWRT